jgi:ribosomal-protein-serine acetyltransferase
MAHIPLHPPPTLRYADETRSLVLRPARVADAPALIEAFEESREALKEFMPWAHMENTVPQQEERLAECEKAHMDGGDVVFHLFDEDGGRILGCAGLHYRTLNQRGVEIGYWVRTSAAGQGIVTLATQCLCVLVFDYLDYDRYQCAYNEGNEGSRRVNEKVGFHVEGRHRNFETKPTDEMLANGCRMTSFTVTTALVPDDIPRLTWYSAIQAGLTVTSAEGHIHASEA